MDINELSTILFDDNGPSKIGIELEVEDTDGTISDTAHTDLYEFLLNLLIIGINKFNFTPTSDNCEDIELKLQYYFNRINILLDLQPICIDIVDDSNIYCKIYIENNKNANDSGLKIIQNPNKLLYTKISEVTGLYILPEIDTLRGRKRMLDDNIYGINIKFNYIF